MKRTIKINLGGMVFHIDEDAYSALQNYLNSLKQHFNGQSSAAEIIEDIETRIAELFQEKINPGKESISGVDVEDVVRILGKPKDFITEDDDDEASTEEKSHIHSMYERRGQRRLYRDVDNAYLGGVASGLGAYFNVEPLYMRLTFVFLIFVYGIGPLLYLVFWLAVPTARTTAQKLEMKGENINLNNIEKAVNEEYEQVKKNLQDFRRSKAYGDFREGIAQIFKTLGMILGGIFRVLAFVIGMALIVGGTLMLIALTGFTFLEFNWVSRFTDIQFISVRDFFQFVTASEDIQLIMISIFLTLAIPLFALIYGGIKMIFRIKTNDRVFGLALLVLWILSLSLGISLVFFETQDFRTYGSQQEETTLSLSSVERLTVKLAKDDGIEESNFYWDFFSWDRDYGYKKQEKDWLFYGKPDFKIQKSDDARYHLIISRESRGFDYEKAVENSRYIEYDWVLRDSTLFLDPYFTILSQGKWRGPDLDIILKIPEGKKAFLDESIHSIVDYIPNNSRKYHDRMVEYTWIMTEDGLTEWNDYRKNREQKSTRNTTE